MIQAWRGIPGIIWPKYFILLLINKYIFIQIISNKQYKVTANHFNFLFLLLILVSFEHISFTMDEYDRKNKWFIYLFI